MGAHLALIDELNDAVVHGGADRRGDVLARITDLFAFGAANYAGEQILLFDDIFTRLVASIEVSARATLANRLANIPNAPPGISRLLASDESIEVAGPIREHFETLDSAILVEQARTKSQRHLLAISRRRLLDTTVTDVLVERGDKPVVLSMAGNPGAAFSESGFSALIKRSQGDDELAICVGMRRDIPRHHCAARVPSRGEGRSIPHISWRRRLFSGCAPQTRSRAQPARDRGIISRRVHVGPHAAGHPISGKSRATKMGSSRIHGGACDALRSADRSGRARHGARSAESVLIIAKAIGITWPTVKLS